MCVPCHCTSTKPLSNFDSASAHQHQDEGPRREMAHLILRRRLPSIGPRVEVNRHICVFNRASHYPAVQPAADSKSIATCPASRLLPGGIHTMVPRDAVLQYYGTIHPYIGPCPCTRDPSSRTRLVLQLALPTAFSGPQPPKPPQRFNVDLGLIESHLASLAGAEMAAHPIYGPLCAVRDSRPES